MKSFSITTFIRLTVIALLLLWLFLIVKPFIGILAWGIILAVALFPLFKKFTLLLGEKHKGKLTTVFSVFFIAILIVPTYMLTSSVITNVNTTVKQIQNNELKVAPPSDDVKTWPLIGEKLYNNWEAFSKDSKTYVIAHKAFIQEKGMQGIKSFAGIIGNVLAFLLSLIIAIMFMVNANGAYQTSISFINKLSPSKNGKALLLVARDTVINVVKGILFVAILQATLCYFGFSYINLPGASLFAFVVLLAAIIGIPVTIVVIPTIAIAFSISDDTMTTTLFSIYIIIISLLDNFLKPILLAKGLKTPMVLVMLGALGGMLLHGIIGLFVGTVLLAVIHQLYLVWMQEDNANLA